MTVSPSVYAAHRAVTELLSGMNVRIKHPDQPTRDFAIRMPYHSVNVSCWIGHAVILHQGATEDDYSNASVDYPVSHEDPDFTSKLGEALLPVVEEYLPRIPEVQDAR